MYTYDISFPEHAKSWFIRITFSRLTVPSISVSW